MSDWVRYALGAASFASAPEPEPGNGMVVVLSKRTGVTHCYQRSIAGLSDDWVKRLLSGTAELAQRHLDVNDDILLEEFACYWQVVLDGLRYSQPISPHPRDTARDLLVSAGFGAWSEYARLDQVAHRGPVEKSGSPALLPDPDPSALAAAAVAGAYAAALAYLSRAEAEAGARVGPLRTAAPPALVGIHRGMR